MVLLQINVTANSGSTGRIAEGIGKAAIDAGHESWIAYGRYSNQSSSNLLKIGSKLNCLEHGIESRLFDNHGLASRGTTKELLNKVDTIKPDIVHLHNIHGYYINFKLLFEYLVANNIPVVWTLHDCWAFTGHCSYFSFRGCDKWKTECRNCPQKLHYPAACVFDNSKRNFRIKKNIYSTIERMTIVSVSQWLDSFIGQSILRNFRHIVIHNGIDTNVFTLSTNISKTRSKLKINDDETMLLGVANIWNERKGLDDFIALHKRLKKTRFKMVLIGLTSQQIRKLPEGIIGITKTESPRELADYYSAADYYLNLTHEDNYPTTNLEAISCGTPCLTYRTGGSPESITAETGAIIEQGNLCSIVNTIQKINRKTPEQITLCRDYALKHFNQANIFKEYINLYDELLRCK